MKILFCHDNSQDHKYHYIGLQKALNGRVNHLFWDINTHSAFLVFDIERPDVVVIDIEHINKDIIKCLKEYPYIKLLINVEFYNEDVKEILELIKSIVFEEIVVYSRNTKRGIEQNLKELKDFKVVSWMKAADSDLWENGEYNSDHSSDFCYIGSPKKALEAHKVLYPICEDFKFKVKVFGNHPWRVPQYCGYCPDNQLKHLSKSAKINLVLPDYCADIVYIPPKQDFFNLAINKSLIYSTMCKSTCSLLYMISVVKDVKNFHAHVYKYVSDNKDSIDQAIESNYNEVKNKHTYEHRVNELLEILK